MSRQTLPLSVHVGIQTLRANPLRTALSTLGVVMGAASLVAVLSLGDGAESFARRQIARRGMQTVAVAAKVNDTVDGLIVPRQDVVRFTADDLRDLAQAMPAGSEVLLSLEGTASLQIAGKPRAALVTAIRAERPRQLGLDIGSGRLFTKQELDESANVAIVTHKLASELAGPQAPESVLGSAIPIGRRTVTVVGIQQPLPGERLLGVAVPYDLAEALMVPAPAARVPTLSVNADAVEAVSAVRIAAEQWADRRDASWRSQGRVTVAAPGLDRLLAMNQGIAVFKILMGAFTAISLVVGGIGIMNVLLASVAERTKEIGVRKAAGARRRDIVVQFLAESVVITVAGAVIGALLGIGVAYVATAIMRAQTMAQVYAGVTWQTLAVAMGAAVLVGLVFGTYPAMKAARLSPVDAMRYE